MVWDWWSRAAGDPKERNTLFLTFFLVLWRRNSLSRTRNTTSIAAGADDGAGSEALFLAHRHPRCRRRRKSGMKTSL